MTSSNTPSDSADQTDPWEELADLVGLEGGKEYVASTPPAAASVEPPASVTPSTGASHGERGPAESAPVERAPEPISHSDYPPRDISPEVTFAPEKAADVVFDDTDQDNAVQVGTDMDAVDETEPPLAADSPVPSEHTASSSAQDSYWDALANWNWDDSEGGAGKSRPDPERAAGGPPARSDGPRGRDDRRGSSGDRPQRGSSPPSHSPPSHSSRPSAATSPPARAERTSAPSPGDDFGLGITENSAEFSSPHAAPGAEEPSGSEASEPPAGARDTARPAAGGSRGEGHSRGSKPGAARGTEGSGEGDFSQKRRRRRRRRGRGGDREQTGSPTPLAPAVPGSDWDDSAGPESDIADEPEAPAAPAGEQPVEERSDDRPGRPPRDRYREPRREGPPRRSGPERAERSEDHFEEEEPQEISMGGGALGSDHGDDAEDESGEPVISYENVPSWEEAISYLLHPNQVQVEPGADGGSSLPRGAAPPDQPRQTRHTGNRKHRR